MSLVCWWIFVRIPSASIFSSQCYNIIQLHYILFSQHFTQSYFRRFQQSLNLIIHCFLTLFSTSWVHQLPPQKNTDLCDLVFAGTGRTIAVRYPQFRKKLNGGVPHPVVHPHRRGSTLRARHTRRRPPSDPLLIFNVGDAPPRRGWKSLSIFFNPYFYVLEDPPPRAIFPLRAKQNPAPDLLLPHLSLLEGLWRAGFWDPGWSQTFSSSSISSNFWITIQTFEGT